MRIINIKSVNNNRNTADFTISSQCHQTGAPSTMEVAIIFVNTPYQVVVVSARPATPYHPMVELARYVALLVQGSQKDIFCHITYK